MDVPLLTVKVFVFLIIGAINLFLALLVWIKGKTKVTFYLGLTSFFSSVYVASFGLAYVFVNSSTLCLFFLRLSWWGVLILPSFITFVYYFTEQIKHVRIVSILFYLTASVIAVLAISTPLFFSEVYLKGFTIFTGKHRIWDLTGRIYIIFCLAFGLIKLIIYYFKATGFKKIQAKYFILGTGTYVLASIIGAGLIPILFRTWGSDIGAEVSSLFSVVWVLLTTYAILRHRFIDIRLVLGKVVIYIMTTGVITASTVFINSINRIFLNLSVGLILVLNSLVVILLFPPVFNFFERISSKYFYYSFYSYKNILTELGKKLMQVLELDKIVDLIINTLTETIKIDKISLFLKQPTTEFYQLQSAVGFNGKEISFIIKDTDLCSYLERTKDILTEYDPPSSIKNMGFTNEKESLQILIARMKRNEINLIIPLIQKGKNIGILFLGEKISGNPYSKEDIEILKTLSFQISISLQNSLLYEEIKKDKDVLEKFYKLTIGRELKMTELKEKMNVLEEKLRSEGEEKRFPKL